MLESSITSTNIPPNLTFCSQDILPQSIDKESTKLSALKPASKLYAPDEDDKKSSWCSEFITLPCTLLSSVRYIGNTVTGILGWGTNGKILGTLRVFSILGIPVAIVQIGKSIASFTQVTINEKVDVLLNISYSAGSIGDGVASGVSGLQSAGVIAAKSTMWLTPLYVVSLALEAAGIVLTIKALAENILFYRQLSKNDQEDSLKLYERKVDLLLTKRVDEKSILNKHFEVKEKRLFNRLLDIELEAKTKIQSLNETIVDEGKALLTKTLAALKKRITTKMISNGITLVAAIVTIAGSILLFTPAQPVGFAFLALGIAIGLSKLVYDRETTRHFENELQLNGVGVHRTFFTLPAWISNWPKKKKRISLVTTPMSTFQADRSQISIAPPLSAKK